MIIYITVCCALVLREISSKIQSMLAGQEFIQHVFHCKVYNQKRHFLISFRDELAMCLVPVMIKKIIKIIKSCIKEQLHQFFLLHFYNSDGDNWKDRGKCLWILNLPPLNIAMKWCGSEGFMHIPILNYAQRMLSYAVYISTEVSYADPGSALPKYSHKHSSFDYCQFRYAAILQKKKKKKCLW